MVYYLPIDRMYKWEFTNSIPSVFLLQAETLKKRSRSLLGLTSWTIQVKEIDGYFCQNSSGCPASFFSWINCGIFRTVEVQNIPRSFLAKMVGGQKCRGEFLWDFAILGCAGLEGAPSSRDTPYLPWSKHGIWLMVIQSSISYLESLYIHINIQYIYRYR